MSAANNNCKCSYCALIAATEVTGDEYAIKREFERIELARSPASIINTNIRLIKAYKKFEQIADTLGVSIEDIINAQTKSPSAGTDGL
ncbi:hypothetical protein J3492_00170 [Psychrobacter sp. F1192]|uniref:HTH cro/C1-type domain-containing protein n=1 Tax=Psychrobacter coccoides TaxID=2818440 RepID=A0ABS3NJW3_9GAMM|nr:hypothetical protein [Psychrobacter coccoides]MBO1529628.1 hypothetical protein [Psychrobacter coccoides]